MKNKKKQLQKNWQNGIKKIWQKTGVPNLPTSLDPILDPFEYAIF